MVVRSRGIRSKSRNVLRKKPRLRGSPPVTHTLAEYADGAHVAIVINPTIHGGMPHVRFQGLTGTVAGKQGHSYRISLRDGGKAKLLVVRPEHLKEVS